MPRLVLAIPLALVAVADPPANPQSGAADLKHVRSAEQQRAVVAIKNLGGKVQFDEAAPGRPVVGVDLSHCPKDSDAGLAPLRALTDLKDLRLHCTKVGDAGLAHVRGLTRLRHLELQYTEVTDAGLAHLKGLSQLHHLTVSDKVTDKGLEHLKNLKELRELFLSYSQVGDAGLAHLAGLSRLETLYLWGTAVTDTGLVHLKGLKRLRHLGLGFTRVTERGEADLLKALSRVEISGGVMDRALPAPAKRP